MWESPAIDVPIAFGTHSVDADENDTPDVVPWSGASLSESWWSVLYGYTDESGPGSARKIR